MTGLDWMNMPVQYKPQPTGPHPTYPSTKTTTTSTTAHPGHEEAWDSPIESPSHPLADHHHHYNHTHTHASGTSTPASAADPGFETPWDSPILTPHDNASAAANTPLTPASETELELSCEKAHSHLALHENLVSRLGSHQHDLLRKEGLVHRRSNPMQKRDVEHPASGSSNGIYGLQSQRGALLTDGASRAQFMQFMFGA